MADSIISSLILSFSVRFIYFYQKSCRDITFILICDKLAVILHRILKVNS